MSNEAKCLSKSFLKKYNMIDVWLENLLHDVGYDIVSNVGFKFFENQKVAGNS